jgi:RND family efflux transporter MFP subunit
METPQAPGRPDLNALKIDERSRRGGSGFGWLRWFAAALGLAVLVSALIFAIKTRAPVVELAEARVPGDNREVLLNASGYVTPRRRATVAAKITGRVEQIFAEEGIRVKAGDVLAILDGSDYRVRLTSAQADRDATAAALQDLQVQWINADRELRRAQALQEGGVSSQQTLDLARTTADSLRAKIELTREQTRAAEERIRVAQQDLDNCTVRSPFTGMVVSKDAQIGEMVSPISAGGGFTRTGIATVVDMQSLEIEVDVNESYIARVKPQMPVAAVLDAYPEWKIPAKVRTIIPTADRQKATVKVRIAFDRLDPRILPDMGVKVTFLGEESGDKERQAGGVQALVPQTAIQNDNGTSIVYIYREGRVERRAVRIGGERGGDREIVAGLSGGEQVVASGFQGLHDGARVEKKP